MGRGTGGGGGRSSGGHSSSSSRSSGGRMSSSGRGSGGIGRGAGTPHGGMGGAGAPRGGMGGGTPRGGFHGGSPHPGGPPPPRYGGMGGMHPVGPPPRRGGCMGCGTTTIALIVIAFIVIAALGAGLSSFASNTSADITASTVEREKLDAQYTTSTEFYVDELGWIRSSSVLNNGLKSFYNSTGVHPLLYITDTVNGTTSPTSEDMEEYAQTLYDELCPDEGHILLLFHCLDGGTDYNMWYVCGNQAKIVMDDEACDILLDYIDAYFYSDRSDEEMFADAFEDAGKRIMNKTVSPIVYVVICASVIALAVLAYVWWKKYKEQKNLEAKQTADILNADIHTLADEDDDLKDLEDKYK